MLVAKSQTFRVYPRVGLNILSIALTITKDKRGRGDLIRYESKRSVLRMLPSLSHLSILDGKKGRRSVRTAARTRSMAREKMAREKIARDSVLASLELVQHILLQVDDDAEGLASILAMLTINNKTPPNDMTAAEREETWRMLGSRYFGTGIITRSRSDFRSATSKFLNILTVEYGTKEGLAQNGIGADAFFDEPHLRAHSYGTLLLSKNEHVQEAIKYLILIHYFRIGYHQNRASPFHWSKVETPNVGFDG